MKKLLAVILALACTLTACAALCDIPEVDLESLQLSMPTNELSEEFEQEGEEGTITFIDTAAPAEGSGEAVEIEGFIPDDLDRLIVGRDDRVQVSNTRSYPFSAIANMKVTAECGDSWECTGFMVGKNFLMTAAHCMVCTKHSSWAKKVTFYFGYQSSSKYLYKYTGRWYATVGTTFPGGYNFDGMSNDWCYVRLDKNVGDKTGWFGFRFASDNDIDNAYYTVAGYRDNKLKYAYGNAAAYNSDLLLFDADDVAGNSGGPIYRSDYYADGIIVAENEDIGLNIGRRISSYIWDYMKKDGFQ